MKMRHCKFQGCRVLVPFNEMYCHKHELVVANIKKNEELEQSRLREVSQGYQQSERHTRYSNSHRSEELGHAFYQSTQWVRLSARVRVKDLYVCQSCGKVQGVDETYIVDHITPRRTAPELAMIESNLWLICRQCHNKKTALEKRMSDEELKKMTKDDWIKLLK